MWRIFLGILIGFCVGADSVPALRLSKPPIIAEWNSNTFTILNNTLEDLWNLTNGRYTPASTATDPDGTLQGDKYDIIIYDPLAGSAEICVNLDGATDWDCATLS